MYKYFLIVFLTLISNSTLAKNQKTLLGGIDSWAPYQFVKKNNDGNVAKGMDIEIARLVANITGYNIYLEETNWSKHQKDVENGFKDLALGATYTPQRAEYSYFTIPYRFEDNALFSFKNIGKKIIFDDVDEFIKVVRRKNYRLGVVKGHLYPDNNLNNFIQDISNSDIIKVASGDIENLDLLLKGEIDGFLADRISGAALIVKKNLQLKIKEQHLGFQIPLHIMLSKATTNQEIVDRFNEAIKTIILSDEYKEIVRRYLYPSLLLSTINSDWFFIIILIGTISFSVSGIAIAAQENSTLFGTLIFAMLPSVGGTIIRDMMINNNKSNIFHNPVYIYAILFMVLGGFIFVRLFNFFDKKSKSDEAIYEFWENILVISDSLGQAAFIVTGVVVAVIENFAPLWLWAPFLAFVTANGGAIVRDVLRRDGEISCMSGEIGPEVSLLWGLILGILLENITLNPTPETIKTSILLGVLGAFATQLIAHYLKIPNIKFKPRRRSR